MGSYIFRISVFVSSSDVADAIANLSMVMIKRNSDQAMTTFSSDNWKMNLYDMYFLEHRKEVGMCHRKLVGYCFHIL